MYAFNRVFREDGSFGFEAELSGAILTESSAPRTAGLRCARPGTGQRREKPVYESHGDDRFGGVVHPNLVG